MNQHQQLVQCLQAEIELIDHLVVTLGREFELLGQPQSGELEEVTSIKRRQVEDMEATGRQRKLVMDAMLGADSSAYDVAEIFKADPQVSALWQQLSAKAIHCRELNRTNGAIVESFSRQVGDALEILQGKQLQNTSAHNLYDQTGHASGSVTKHSLTQV